jgi:hypothetical protein
LGIWQLAREVAVEIPKMSLEQLPKFEQFETGQQIHSKCELLGKKLNNFIKHFER